MTIEELKNEIEELNDKHDNFELCFRSLEENHIFIIDNIIKEIDYRRGMIYLEGYETPFKY